VIALLLWLAVSISGIASWGDFNGHVVTRYPRGTPIRVCGPLDCWSGASWGYGPDPRTNRIADLDREVFRRICGDPSMGLCRVTLTARLGALSTPPPTSSEGRGTSAPSRTGHARWLQASSTRSPLRLARIAL